MRVLAASGIDIYNKHNTTGTNALHVAVQRRHWHIVRMLAESGYDMNRLAKGGLSALIIASSDKNAFNAIQHMT